MPERLASAVALAIVGVCVLVGSLAIADGIRDRGRSDVLTVTGSAKRRIQSDYVIWNSSLTSRQPTAQAASKELARWTARFQAFLAEAGARPDELTVQPVATATETETNPDTGNPTGRVIGFALTRTFQLRSNRVDDVAKLIEASAELLNENVPITAEPPEYVYTKLPSLRPVLLEDATKDALARAEVLARATDANLGSVRSVNVGVFQVTSPNSTEVSDYGVYDISTRAKDVTAVVNVTLALG
ncbi:MAG: SIMPL domain-containing protein [Gaiellaceae bacterium]